MSNCTRPLTGLTPITDLGQNDYIVGAVGYAGGLYPNRSNQLPLTHDALGRIMASAIAPRSPSQRIVFASIGYSFTRMVWDEFEPLVAADPAVNPLVLPVNLAHPGKDASDIATQGDTYWTTHVPAKLALAGIQASEVQAVWINTGEASPTQPFPAHAAQLTSDVVKILQNVKYFFPNAQHAFLTSSHYMGYFGASVKEPASCYEQAWAIKWAIEKQLSGDPSMVCIGPGAVVPWVAWAGYPWCDGSAPRADGLSMLCPQDYTSDGGHPSPAGSKKLAEILLRDLKSMWPSKLWFCRVPTASVPETPPTQTAG